MPRDYAKYKPKQAKQKRVEQGWQKRLILLMVFLCVLGVVIFAIYIYKNKAPDSLHPQLNTWISQLQSRFSRQKTDVIAKLPVTQQAEQEPEVRFNFYTELPKMQVTLNETEEAPSAQAITRRAMLATNTSAESSFQQAANQAQPANEQNKQNSGTENKTQYVVQLGLFKNETTAGQTRVSLLLAGCEADTVTVIDEATQTTLYRLQKGPYATLSQAKTIVKQLQKKGVSGMVKQL